MEIFSITKASLHGNKQKLDQGNKSTLVSQSSKPAKQIKSKVISPPSVLEKPRKPTAKSAPFWAADQTKRQPNELAKFSGSFSAEKLSQ